MHCVGEHLYLCTTSSTGACTMWKKMIQTYNQELCYKGSSYCKKVSDSNKSKGILQATAVAHDKLSIKLRASLVDLFRKLLERGHATNLRSELRANGMNRFERKRNVLRSSAKSSRVTVNTKKNTNLPGMCSTILT